jgi:hypothetical protein
MMTNTVQYMPIFGLKSKEAVLEGELEQQQFGKLVKPKKISNLI